MTLRLGDQQSLSSFGRFVKRTIFASRWLLAPLYLGLSIALVLVVVEFVRGVFHLVIGITASEHAEVVVGILSLIELSLLANLVLMVMFAGYENFVSRLDIEDQRDKPDWMDEVGHGDLKLKLMTSIVAISAIQLLEGFSNVAHESDRNLAWWAGLHGVFIVSAVLLALMDRISHR
jgi:uncharacterized protein (TIGR00645 family)